MAALAMSRARNLKRVAKSVLRPISTRWYSTGRLTRDLRSLGVRAGACLMVHSSLSSIGYVPGGPRAVISALLASIKPGGTLVMPTHTWDRSGAGDFRFDVRSTPSCVGAISELFRNLPGVSRSLHPTHSVAAIGPQSDYLTTSHETAATPCGPGTPYAKLIEQRGQILFLGTTLDKNTLFHTLEALAHVPYLMREADEAFTITDSSGITRVVPMRRHNRGPNRRFAITLDFLEQKGIARSGLVGDSRSLLLECAEMADAVMDLLKRDPEYLLEQ